MSYPDAQTLVAVEAVINGLAALITALRGTFWSRETRSTKNGTAPRPSHSSVQPAPDVVICCDAAPNHLTTLPGIGKRNARVQPDIPENEVDELLEPLTRRF